MAILSLIGSKEFGGHDLICRTAGTWWWSIAFSLVFYYWGVNSGYRSEYLRRARRADDEVLEGMGAH